jgi:hypothetical protein
MHKPSKVQRIFFYVIFSFSLLSARLNAEAHALTEEKENTISYNVGSTLLWGIGATFVPLTYIFIPITYTRKINSSWSFAQFLLYRFEHYTNPSMDWHKFHEIFILPGLRYNFSQEYENGLYLSVHVGGGLGVGPNLSFKSLNAYSEIGYIIPNIYKDLYCSINLGFLYSHILSSSSPNHPSYSWSKSNLIAKLSHIITPIGMVSVGLKF